MSYQAAAALQAAIYARLSGFAGLAGVSIVDAMPAGTALGTFVLIGPEQVMDQSDASGGGAEHRFEIAVISDASGFSDRQAGGGRGFARRWWVRL